MGLELVQDIRPPSDADAVFGGVVRMHGNNMIVSSAVAGGNNDGADQRVHFYCRNAEGNWVFKQTISSEHVDGGSALVGLGVNTGIYGNTAVVGQWNTGTVAPGRAHILVRGNDGVWSHKQTLIGDDARDLFGATCAVYGNYILVGAYQGGPRTDPADPTSAPGAVYWYVRDRDGTYKRVQKIVGPEGGAGEEGASGEFGGIEVSLYGNYAMVTSPAYGNGTNVGRVYFYSRHNDGTWYQTGTDTGRTVGGQDDRLGRGGVRLYENYAVASTARANNGTLTTAGYVNFYIRNRQGKWERVERVYGDNQADGLGQNVHVYGNFIYVTLANDADTDSIRLYRRNGAGDYGLADSLTFPGGSRTSQATCMSVYGTYVAVGETSATLPASGGRVFFLQYKA